MDLWDQKLNDSQILESINTLNTKLNRYNEAELSIEDRGYLDKIRAVNEQAQIIVENADPRTINYSSLLAVRDNFNNISSYLDNWNGGASPTYLNSYAIQHTDEALRSIPLMSTAINIPGARAAISNLRRSAARQNTIVNEITEKIKEKGSLADETIDEKVATYSGKIETQVTDTQDKIKNINIEANEIAEQLEEAKVAASRLATEQNETFNTAQTERTKRFEVMIKEQQNEADGVFTSISSKVTDEVKDVKARAETSAKLADDARIKSQELLGIVSQNALISDYSKNGLHEQKWSRIWQSITLLSLVATVITGALLALGTNSDTSWQKLVARFGVLIATSGLAAYAAAQANEHKRAQRHSEHLSLQLSAVRPYLAGIDQAGEREKLLVKLAERFFSEWEPKDMKQRRGKKKENEKMMISGDDLPGLVGALISIVNMSNKK